MHGMNYDQMNIAKIGLLVDIWEKKFRLLSFFFVCFAIKKSKFCEFLIDNSSFHTLTSAMCTLYNSFKVSSPLRIALNRLILTTVTLQRLWIFKSHFTTVF